MTSLGGVALGGGVCASYSLFITAGQHHIDILYM